MLTCQPTGSTTTSSVAVYFLITLQTFFDVTGGKSQTFDTRPFIVKNRRQDHYSDQFFTTQNFNPDEDIQSYQPIVDRFDFYGGDPNVLTDAYGNQVRHSVNYPPDLNYESNAYPDQNSNSLADDGYVNPQNQYSNIGVPPPNRGIPYSNNPPPPPIPSPTQATAHHYPPSPPNKYDNYYYRNSYRNPPEPTDYPQEYNPVITPTGSPPPIDPSGAPPNPYQNSQTQHVYNNYDQGNFPKQPPLPQPTPNYKQPYVGSPGAPNTGGYSGIDNNPPVNYNQGLGPLNYDANYQSASNPSNTFTQQSSPPNVYNAPRPFDVPSPSTINSLQYLNSQSSDSVSRSPTNSFNRNPFQNNFQNNYNLQQPVNTRASVNPVPYPTQVSTSHQPASAYSPNSGYNINQNVPTTINQPQEPPPDPYEPRYPNYQGQDPVQNDFTNYQSSQQQFQIADSPRQNVYYDQTKNVRNYRRPAVSTYAASPSIYSQSQRPNNRPQRKTAFIRGNRQSNGNYRQQPQFNSNYDFPGSYQTLQQKQSPDGSYIY